MRSRNAPCRKESNRMFGIPRYLKHVERTRPARIRDDAERGDRGILGAEGATLVEMALSASVLFVMLFGIIEVCMGLYSYNLVSEAARQATRYAAVRGTNSCTYATKTFPNCNLNPTSAGNPIQTYVQGLGFPYSSQMNATATWWTAVQDASGSTTWPTQCTAASCNAIGNAVKVQVTYSFPLPIPFWNNATLNIKSTSELMISE